MFVAERPYAEVTDIDSRIFRTYDIRGIVKTQVTPDVVYTIGRAIGSRLYRQQKTQIIVGHDARLSSPALNLALIQGLQDSGCTIVDIGLVPTPVLYFATQHLKISAGIMLTASHNPADYNGLKIVLNGNSLAEHEITELYQACIGGDFVEASGSLSSLTVSEAYIEKIANDINLAKPLKIVVDCGNGVAGVIAPSLFRTLGCEVVELFCDLDGCFPNHHPDPSRPENLGDLIKCVQEQQADLGIAFDGDGDRIGVVTNAGSIIWPDRLLMLLAEAILAEHPGRVVIYDVKSTAHLENFIKKCTGKPLMWKTGHSVIKAKMRETAAILAGEMSGHIFINDRWYGFDDALYAAARILEILSQSDQNSESIFAVLPNSVNTPELSFGISDEAKYQFMQDFIAAANFPEGKMNQIDGIRVDFNDGFGLLRASNTTPNIVMRFEAENQAGLLRIQEQFRRELLKFSADLCLPF